VIVADRTLEVRPVGVGDFDEIAPLLDLFENKKMSRADWRTMLFDYPWWSGDIRGYALYAEGTPVGFIGTVFSRRSVSGRDEVFCNLSSWIVRDAYRSGSILLVKAVLGIRDCTLVNLTPTERSYDIFAKLGFRPLESEQLLLAPLASPIGFLGASYRLGREDITRRVDAESRRIVEGIRACPQIKPILIESHGRTCLIFVRGKRVRGVRIAEILSLDDPELFWRHRALVHVAAARATGGVGLLLDARYAGERRPRGAFRRVLRRSFRASRPDVTPMHVDGLYTELMYLSI
jgi:hypothetical protein